MASYLKRTIFMLSTKGIPLQLYFLRQKLFLPSITFRFHSSDAYHPALSSLSWLFGVWESVEAEVFYPTMETIKYKETMEYLPTMHPVLEYKSETWHPVKKTKLHCERGFLRIDPESNKLALMTSHIFGLNELSEGSVENKTLRLESQSFSKMSFCKIADTVKIIRKLWLKDEDLYYTVDMETVGQPLQAHVRTRYKKKV